MRLAGQAKMGYYPTPPELLPLLCKCLQRAGSGLLRVFDPCAGEGHALKALGEHLDAITYGIELDRERGITAQRNLYECLIGDCQTAMVSRHFASLLLLNPPYDWSAAGDVRDKSERYERTFLRDTVKALRPEGVLIYLIPLRRLDRKVARMLSHRFQEIRLFRLPDELYRRFHQVVVFGVARAKLKPDEAVHRYLVDAGAGRAVVPPLPDEPDFVYPVPPSLKVKPLVFRTNEIDPEELEREIASQGLHDRLLEMWSPSRNARKLEAIMPLRSGHLAQLIACGLVGGVVRDRDGLRPLLVKGTTKKEVDRRIEHEKGKERHIETERFVITVNAYDRDGCLITIQ